MVQKVSSAITAGHAALLGLELLDERARWFKRAAFNEEDVDAVRAQCVFTTHTPVPAGHDRFSADLIEEHLGPLRERMGLSADGKTAREVARPLCQMIAANTAS